MPTLARSDVTLAYEVSGDGPPLLMIQGVGAGGGGWGPQVDGLAGEYRILTFDNRGFGRSAPCRGPVSIEALAARVGGLIGRDLANLPPIVMQQVRALSRHDTSDRLGRLVGVPTLVVSGELDPIARPEYGRMLAERIPGAAFEVWPGTAHGLMLQRPEEVNDRLRRFLAEAEAGTAARGKPGGR